jgi:DNA-directed RNA polymerase sigma subunit (sigma70/sigma32)
MAAIELAWIKQEATMNLRADTTDFPGSYEFQGGLDSRSQEPSTGGTFVLRRAHYLSETVTPSLNSEQQHVLTNLVEEVDSDMRHNMVVHNLRMVVSIAQRYTNRGLELVDLVRAGNRGLIQAMDKFDPEGGFCFTTYVTWCVSQKMEHAIARHNNALPSANSNPAENISFEKAVRRHAETCVEYPAGCSGKLAW